MAVHATVVVPSANTLPDGGTQATVTPGVLSEAVAVNVTTAVASPGSVEFVMSAGTVKDGDSSSITVTSNESESVFRDVSVAVQVTMVAPIGTRSPTAGCRRLWCRDSCRLWPG